MEALKEKGLLYNLLSRPWGSPAGLPSPEPNCQDHSMPVGGTQEQAAVVSFKTGLLERLTSLSNRPPSLSLVTKGLRTRISSMSLAQRNGMTRGRSPVALWGLLYSQAFPPTYIFVSGTFIFPSSICFVSFWIFFFHI